MADLDPLIRLYRHTVEERQKILSALYREAEQMEMKKRVLQEQMARERVAAEADSSPDAIIDYTRYASNVRRKIEQIDHDLKKMESRIAAAQEDVRAAFAEQKKAEIVHRRRSESARRDRDTREAKTLDDVAIEGHRRAGGDERESGE